ILKAWQQRQDRFRTVQVTFEGEHVVTKGVFSRRPPPKDLKQDDVGPLPPEDHKAWVAELLVIGAGKYRHEIKGGHNWLAQERRFVTVDSTVTYDGKTRK